MLAAFVVCSLVALATFFVARKLGRVAGVSGWWFSPVFFLPFVKLYIVIPSLIGLCVVIQLLKQKNEKKPIISVNRVAVSKSDKVGIAYRFGQWFSRSVLGFSAREKKGGGIADSQGTLDPGVSVKVAAGLIALAVVGTYVIVHPRPHHFESWKGDSSGTVLLDTDTGVLCSTRVIKKWTDANEEEVNAASQAAERARDALGVAMGELNSKLDDSQWKFNCATAPANSALDVACEKYGDMEEAEKEAESKEGAARRKADAEEIETYPLCKDIR